jgi:hypothetical protein
MPRKKTKKKTKSKPVPSGSVSTNRSLHKADWLQPILFLVLGLGFQYVILVESTFGVYFGWGCSAIALGFFLYLMWKQISWPRSVKVPLACVITVVFLWSAYHIIKERLRPSFVFVTPVSMIPEDTWYFGINHRGPKTSYGTQILFVDQDRADFMKRTQTSLSPSDMNSFQVLLSFPEVNPMGHGNIYQLIFPWKPFSPTHSRFNADITWRDGTVHQELEIAKVQEKWTYRMKITDRHSEKILLWCKDSDFPSHEPIGPCFPDVVQLSN